MTPCKRGNFVQLAIPVIKERRDVLVASPAQAVKIQEPNARTASPIDLGDLKGQQSTGLNVSEQSIFLPLCQVLPVLALQRLNPTRIYRL